MLTRYLTVAMASRASANLLISLSDARFTSETTEWHWPRASSNLLILLSIRFFLIRTIAPPWPPHRRLALSSRLFNAVECGGGQGGNRRHRWQRGGGPAGVSFGGWP